MTAYQATVTTTQGRQTVGYVIFATEAFCASRAARRGIESIIGAETVKL